MESIRSPLEKVCSLIWQRTLEILLMTKLSCHMEVIISIVHQLDLASYECDQQ